MSEKEGEKREIYTLWIQSLLFSKMDISKQSFHPLVLVENLENFKELGFW